MSLTSLGVLVVGLVVIASGCGTTTVTVQPTPAATVTVTATPTPVQTVTPVPRTGDTVAIGAVDVLVTGYTRLSYVPFLQTLEDGPFGYGAKAGKGWEFVVVVVRFRNVGTSDYHSTVAQWAWLRLRGNPYPVDACAHSVNDVYTDLQSTKGAGDGQMQLEPGQYKKWAIAFRVPKAARPSYFTYQGPGNKKATWRL